jgi:predicted secreted protein
MNIISGIIVFLLIWWTALFAVLPWGVRQNQDGVQSGIQAAPQNPMLKKKLIVTTIISTILWLLVYFLIESDIISFREMAKDM